MVTLVDSDLFDDQAREGVIAPEYSTRLGVVAVESNRPRLLRILNIIAVNPQPNYSRTSLVTRHLFT